MDRSQAASLLRHEPAANEIGKLLAMIMPILYAIDSRASAETLCTCLSEHRERRADPRLRLPIVHTGA
jgi:hypothetical protein